MKIRPSCSWSVWSQFMSGSALNLFQLARLLPERDLSMVLCHEKRDAYPFKSQFDLWDRHML